MAEKYTYTVPQVVAPPATAAAVEIAALVLRRLPTPWIHVVLQDDQGRTSDVHYTEVPAPTGATAASLMRALNKANLTVKSLERRVMEQLVADLYVVPQGAIGGVPD